MTTHHECIDCGGDVGLNYPEFGRCRECYLQHTVESAREHWHDCHRCSGQQQCDCDAPTEPMLCDGCARKIAERVWIKAKAWVEARKKEYVASQGWGRAEATMLRADPWDPALKTAYVRAREEWEQANKELCEAEEALAKEAEQ